MTPNIMLRCAILMAITSTACAAGSTDAMFLVRTTTQLPDEVVAAIKSHAERRKWQYLGENKVRKGEVRLVKVCIPEIGQIIWPVGMQLSALLPCGNIGIYSNGAGTEISVLNPRYMHVLYPHPATERAAALAQPLMMEMLDAVTK